ncbi:MAG: hypothetical protein DRJ66_07015 [Thermoprotei archaeon]|nr:MAG: hypothetical protein DRJ66_07015 [Thermoprotei archaeon]RLF21026.1 MAG: hypothetical protein DRZ82_00115 [Thermoprotei archaeon]
MAKKVPSKLIIPKEVFFKLRVQRNPNVVWKKYPSGDVAIMLKMKQTFWAKFISFFADLPETKKLVLDKMGSRIWEMCDGKHTVQDLIDMLVREYKLRRREAEVSLIEYLKRLIKRGLIVLLPPEEKLGGEEKDKSIDSNKNQ